MYMAVIISDVIINTYTALSITKTGNILSFAWVCQVLFMLFLLITVKRIIMIGETTSDLNK